MSCIDRAVEKFLHNDDLRNGQEGFYLTKQGRRHLFPN